MKTVAVIEGDGIGREVVPAALRVLHALGVELALERFDVGAERFLASGVALPDTMMDELAEADAVLLGAIGDPRVADPAYSAQALGRIRSDLDLFANVRPARLLDERLSPLRDPLQRRVDLIVVRENTEGLYGTLGGRFKRGTDDEVALQEHISTYRGVSRVMQHAFSIARREVVMADKWSAMPHAGELWQRCWRKATEANPGVGSIHMAVDACALHLTTQPSSFDVIVTENCFGDILSDVAAAMVGGLGVMPSANLNTETGRAMFEPVHGSAPDIAGRGIANPLAAILTSALMLQHLGFGDEAKAIEGAVAAAVRARECTGDVGGCLSTSEAAEAVMARLETTQRDTE